MAKLSITLILIISCVLASNLNAYANREGFPKPGPKPGPTPGEELTRIRLYVHDLRIGHVAPTVYEVAKASVTSNSPTNFGSVHVLDDLITEGPSIQSKALGRIQGLTTNADLRVIGVAMNLNFFFTEGKYNGSTLCILGRNQVMDPEREMPIVGGSGFFRFARGYALQTSVSFDQVSMYAVLEYNLYVTTNPNYKVDHDMEIEEMWSTS